MQKLSEDYGLPQRQSKLLARFRQYKICRTGNTFNYRKDRSPTSKKFKTFENLPSIIEEYGTAMQNSDSKMIRLSCSLAESLSKQDLFINSTIAQLGACLLWNLLKTV
jgi:hypothetical protein